MCILLEEFCYPTLSQGSCIGFVLSLAFSLHCFMLVFLIAGVTVAITAVVVSWVFNATVPLGLVIGKLSLDCIIL